MRETEQGEPTSTRRGRGRGRLIWGVVAAVTLVFLIHTFVAHPFKVEENSMKPTFGSGDWVVIDKLTPAISHYARGDVVIVKSRGGGFTGSGFVPAHIARIIGLPGDTVDFDNGSVYVTLPSGERREEDAAPPAGAPGVVPEHWLLNEGQYFVLGDNRPELNPVPFGWGLTWRGAFEGRVWEW